MERNKILSKKSKLNSLSYLNSINVTKSNSNKKKNSINNSINNSNILISKFNENKKNSISYHTKKFTIIQNFSRYKKKSTILNMNSGLKDIFHNDENYNRENKIRVGNTNNYIINNKKF